jgi:hypothetical protein
MPDHAGLDSSGVPDFEVARVRHHPYVTVAAGVDAAAGLDSGLRDFRRALGMDPSEECHGHQMSEDMRTTFLRLCDDCGVRFSALVIDMELTWVRHNGSAFPAPLTVQTRAACTALARLPGAGSLQTLDCDEDVNGRAARAAFVTELRR